MRLAEKWMYKTVKGSNVHRLLLRIVFSCDIPCGVKIGKNVQLPHNGNGVIIHNNAIIGDDCVIFQHVTIGGNGTIKNGETVHGAPVLEKGVAVFTGACVLGPITIGHDSYIAANTVITKDIPPNSLAIGNPAVIKERSFSYFFAE